jgi:putative membrane protein
VELAFSVRACHQAGMRWAALLLALLGLGLTAGLVAWQGVGPVLDGVARVGLGGVLIVTGVRVAAVGVAGIGWRLLLPRRLPCPATVPVTLRYVREAINALLPVAQVGGDVAGGRLLSFWGVPGAVCGASIVVDTTMQAGTQFVFALIGIAVLAAAPQASRDLVLWLAGGSALAAAALLGFLLAQRLGLFKLAEGALRRLARAVGGDAGHGGGDDGGALAGLHDAIQAIYRARGRIAASFAVHLAGWLVGVGEVWAALALMGRDPTLAEALVLESLGQAVRGAAFAVPGALGAQEGGFVVLGALYGLPADAALALSLVKRIPDFMIGIPGLLAWQALEGRRAFLRRRRRGRRGRA